MNYDVHQSLAVAAARGRFRFPDVLIDADGPYPPTPDPAAAGVRHPRIVAGLSAILLGGFGVHKFILGYTETGMLTVALLLFSCAFAWPVLTLIGIVEGIVYLCKSDADFYMTYVVQRRSWF